MTEVIFMVGFSLIYIILTSIYFSSSNHFHENKAGQTNRRRLWRSSLAHLYESLSGADPACRGEHQGERTGRLRFPRSRSAPPQGAAPRQYRRSEGLADARFDQCGGRSA